VTTELRDLIEARLREAGLKLTPQRFAVLDYLVRHPTHPTAEQIGAGVNRRFPRVSRATIYNTLHSLCETGLVREVYLEDATARYDANVKPHHHFVCRSCGRLEDVPAEALGALPRADLETGYRVESFQVVMRGICGACAEERSRKRNSARR